MSWGEEFQAKIFLTLAQMRANVFANSQSLGNKVLVGTRLGLHSLFSIFISSLFDFFDRVGGSLTGADHRGLGSPDAVAVWGRLR